jgi:hypothetical protein
LAFHRGFDVGNLCKGNMGGPSSEWLHSEHLTMASTPSLVLPTLCSLEKMNCRGKLIEQWYLAKEPSSHSWKFKLLLRRVIEWFGA